MADIAKNVHVYLQTIASVTSIAGDRGHPDHKPKGVTTPAYVYSQISTNEETHLGGQQGIAESTVQIDCYAETRLQSASLAEAIRLAMLATGPLTMDSVTVDRVYTVNQFTASEPPKDASDEWEYRFTIEYRLMHDIATP